MNVWRFVLRMKRRRLLSEEDIVPQVADSVYDDHVLSRSSSFCLPSSCTAIDVRKAIADLIGGFGIADAHNETFVSILTATDDNQCYVDSDEPTEFDGANYAFL